MSWQAGIANVLLRVMVRRRWTGWTPGVEGARMLRRVFGQPRAMRDYRARSARVTKVREVIVEGEWVLPLDGTVEDGRTILYLHGGGYVFCTEETHRPLTTTLANLAKARVFAPAYRLAPEHPFPAAVDDALAAAAWLFEQGVDPARTIVAGDSAGGGLALALLIARRDAGLPPMAGAYLLSPWTDLAGTGASMETNRDRDAMFNPGRIATFAREYLGDVPATHPLASPLYAELAGLPPLCIQAGSDEVLLDDARRLAERARAAGVDVSITTWPGVPHVWQLWTPYLPEAREAIARAVAWITARVPARTREAAAGASGASAGAHSTE